MAFSMRLERFCCCCTLRTGSLIIGTAGWIFTFIELFCFVGPAVNKSEENQNVNLSNDLELNSEEIDKFWSDAQSRNLYYQIGVSVATLIVCILLIVGIYKKDNRYMLPWLVLKCFEGVLTVLAVVIAFIIACSIPQLRAIFFVLTFVFILVSVLVWYSWLCVWSHYKEVGEQTSAGNTLPQVYFAPTEMPPPSYPEVEKSKMNMA